jgi:hypothetical protein
MKSLPRPGGWRSRGAPNGRLSCSSGAASSLTAGALACLWILIFALKATTPVDPAEKELLAHIDPHAPAPDFTLMAEQIRLAEAWTASGQDFEPQERQRP